MTDKPEDYIPAKHRIAEALRKVEADAGKAVEDINAQAVPEPPPAAEPASVTDFAMLGAQAILKYGEASAVHCEQVGDEVMADAQSVRDVCFQLAEDIRHVARVQAAAVERAMTRNKIAAQGVSELRKQFHDDIARERGEIEAKKQRATG
jgi:hypothetical protein